MYSTLQWTKQPTNNTAFCLVQHWCDHISDCCDSIEWLWSHNPDPLHTLCTWSPIDGDQLRSPSCSCWHLELQIQTRKHERRNVRAHCNVHLCLERVHRCDVMCESVSQPHRWSIVRELTNKSGHKALKANSQRIPQPYHTHQHKVECPVYWEKYLDFNNFILQTPRRRWTLNIECIISASTFQHTWFW